MAKHIQYNDQFPESVILGLTGISERNVGDLYRASDTGNLFEVVGNSLVFRYSRTLREVAFATVDSQDVNDNDTIDITVQQAEGNWQDNGDGSITYLGTPTSVMIHSQILQTSAGQRAAPILNLEKTNVQISTSATGYIRSATGHNMSSNSIAGFRDINPGTNPTYRLTSGQESDSGSTTTSLTGHFDLEAITNI